MYYLFYLGVKMSDRKSVKTTTGRTQHVEVILEFGHKATLKDEIIKVLL